MNSSENNWPAWATEKVVIKDYDSTWPQKAVNLIKTLRQIAPSLNVFHIGSTAVEGMAAKPVIDLMAYTNVAELGNIVDKMIESGWQVIPVELTNNHSKRTLVLVENDKRAAHFHLVTNQKDLDEHVLFVKLLSGNRVLAGQYATLKKALAEKHENDREAYTNAKGEFITSALKSSP